MSGARVVNRVLLVDGAEVQLNQWTRDCIAANKIAVRAFTKAEAVRLAREQRPEMAVVEIFLTPPDNGLDVIRELKLAHPSIVAILVSGYISVDLAMLGVAAGADDCFSKTARCAQLIRRVETGRRSVPAATFVPTLEEVEWDHVSRVLNDCNGNVTLAAELLGEHRYTLQRIIRKHSPRVLRSGPVPRRGRPKSTR